VRRERHKKKGRRSPGGPSIAVPAEVGERRFPRGCPNAVGARLCLLVIRAIRTGACHKTLTCGAHYDAGDELRDSRRRDDHDFGQATPDVRGPPRSWSLAFLVLFILVDGSPA
jgi:hypothetical protein